MTAKQIVGRTAPDGSEYVTLTDGDGSLASLTLSTGDLELGAVELKNGSDDTRATVTASNALKVDGSAVTQPVSLATLPVTNAGTFAVQSAQSGTWTVQPGNTANTTAWKVDGSAVTQPVSGTITAVTTLGTVTNVVHVDDNSGSLTTDSLTDGTVAAGTAATKSKLTGSVYNATVPAATDGQGLSSQSDSTGSQYVNSTGRRATYTAEADPAALNASGTVLEIQGSSTKTVRINRIFIDGTMTAGINALVAVVRRSTACSSGTPTTITAGKHDTNSGSPTAVVRSFSGTPPTLGTLVAVLPGSKAYFGATTERSNPAIFDFGTRGGQALVLRGTSEFATLTVTSASFTGASFNIYIEWTEE